MNIEIFLPPLAGSIFGFVLGFIANYVYQLYKNNEDKKKYKAMIKSEIELCIKALELDQVQFLPIDSWNSAINSGALRLFDVNTELSPLSLAYQKIKDYNQLIATVDLNEAKWDGVLEGVDSDDFTISLPFSNLVAGRDWLLEKLKFTHKQVF